LRSGRQQCARFENVRNQQEVVVRRRLPLRHLQGVVTPGLYEVEGRHTNPPHPARLQSAAKPLYPAPGSYDSRPNVTLSTERPFMIPVAMVTGFLGSGKTTLLHRLVRRYADHRLVYLVNEFSPVDVDGALLEREEDDVVAVPGGSIFCTCLVTEFVQALTAIPERFHDADAPVEGVVIEASGVADPRVTERLFRETHLDDLYALASVTSVVDPASFPTLLQTLPNIRAQVEASDTAIVNKADLFGEDALADVEAQLRAIAPDLRILRASYCDVPLDGGEAGLNLFGERLPRGLDGDYATCVDPNYARLVLRFPGPTDAAVLRDALNGMRDRVYRAKGYVPTPDGVQYLDVSPAAVTLKPADAEEERPAAGCQVALIARGTAFEELQAFVREVKAGKFAAG
jgi:G3E family GTPase